MKPHDPSTRLLMNWEEWSQYDAVGLAELVRNKHATPHELASQVVAGIAKVNPAINAVIEVFEDVVDQPLKDGMNSEGCFFGVPFLVKDLGPTLKGRKQEMGSLLMQGNIAAEDSFLTTKIRGAGFNIMGRTTTSEFGKGAAPENPAVYITRNPWDLAYTPGGSSAGTGAIVATGAIPISSASDGGGSTRTPAAISGSIGLKASRGVFSGAPHGSDLISLAAVSGCITRSVRDTAAFVDACRGGAAGEFMPYWLPKEPYLELIQRDPPKLRIALSHEWGDFCATSHIASELERAGVFLEGLGHYVDWRNPAVDFRAAFAVSTENSMTSFARYLDRLAALRGHTRPTELLEPMCAKIWAEGKRRLGALEKIPVIYNQISREFGAFFEDWDVVLTPVMSRPTPKVGSLDVSAFNDKLSADEYFSNYWALYPHMIPTNLCGIPGISLPMAMQENGLPLGTHAVARQGNDGLLLQLAAQVERALNGKWNEGRRPTIHVTNP